MSVSIKTLSSAEQHNGNDRAEQQLPHTEQDPEGLQVTQYPQNKHPRARRQRRRLRGFSSKSSIYTADLTWKFNFWTGEWGSFVGDARRRVPGLR